MFINMPLDLILQNFFGVNLVTLFLSCIFPQQRKVLFSFQCSSLQKSVSKFTTKELYEIDPWNLYSKTLRIRNVRKMVRLRCKLAFLLLPITFTGFVKRTIFLVNLYIKNLLCFIAQAPGTCTVKLFTLVIYAPGSCAKKAWHCNVQ
jgi:hypothetical protein